MYWGRSWMFSILQNGNDLHNDHGDIMFIISPCNDLGFLTEKVKIEKAEKLAIANLLDKKEFVIQVNLKQALN